MHRAAASAEARARRPPPEVQALTEELAHRGAEHRALAIVLGSGLGGFVERLRARRVIPSEELEHMPRPRVQGHAGEIVLGELEGLPVLVQSGRAHLYEGRSPLEVTRAVRAYAALGVRAIVLTNASGSLVPSWRPGTLVCLADHLNLQGKSPLLAGEDGRASPYDAALGDDLERVARALSIPFERGVYAGLLGPSYETPAEIRALQGLGAHLVGMSTVAEASAARAAGLRVVALSCVANPAAGLGLESLSHEDVLSVMRRSTEKLGRLLAGVAEGWKGALAAPARAR